MESINIRKLDDLDFRSNEAYKKLRANIQFCGDEVRVIAVTSCAPKEGKTSVAMNLARSLADLDKKVLFIDADLRSSAFVNHFRVDGGGKGLIHFLADQEPFHNVVYETNVNKLHMVSAGPMPSNPAELLSNRYFKELIPALKNVYDYVIIDTPPLGSYIDSAIIARECDGIAMVIESGRISYKFAQKVLSQLKKADCRILGVVLNKVNLNKKGYSRKHYGQYGVD